MTEQVNQFLTSLGYGVATGIVLALVHVLLWRQPWRLSRPAAYGVGTLAIGAGIFAASLATDGLASFALASGVALPCGAVVVVCYYVRGALRQLERGGRKRDALVGLIVDDLGEDADGTTGRSHAGWH